MSVKKGSDKILYLIYSLGYSSMASMTSFGHHPGSGSGLMPGGAVGLGSSMSSSPGACLQQRDQPTVSGGMGSVTGGYSCMTRPPTYDHLGLGYTTRPSPCSPTQPYQMNGHQYNTNGSSSTGKFHKKKFLRTGFDVFLFL